MNKIRTILIHTALAAAIFALLPAAARAGEIGYLVTVDTTSVSGTSGYLDFQFNGGGADSQPASVFILSFTSDGVLGPVFPPFGAVSGDLPVLVDISNTGGPLNDYFQAFTFGNSIVFDAIFVGPALNAPNGTSTSGSEFAFSMFDGTGVTPLLTSNPFGFAATVDVNLDGTTTPTTFQSPTGGPSAVTLVSGVPEPGTLLLGFPVVVFALWRRRK